MFPLSCSLVENSFHFFFGYWSCFNLLPVCTKPQINAPQLSELQSVAVKHFCLQEVLKDAGLLAFMLTSRGGWGCVKLNSEPKARMLYWSEWKGRRENGLSGGKYYITLGFLPNTFSLVCHVGCVHCIGLCLYISGRVGGDKTSPV